MRCCGKLTGFEEFLIIIVVGTLLAFPVAGGPLSLKLIGVLLSIEYVPDDGLRGRSKGIKPYQLKETPKSHDTYVRQRITCQMVFTYQ